MAALPDPAVAEAPAAAVEATTEASPGLKRPLESEAQPDAAPAKRRLVEREPASTAAPKAIAAALQEEGSPLPPAVSKLLEALAEGCLSVPRDRRQPFQEKVAGLLRETLDAVDADLRRKVQLADADLEDKDAEMVTRQATEANAQAKCATLRLSVLEKKKRLNADTLALRKTTEKVTEALAVQENGDVNIVASQSQRDRLEEADAKILTPLKAGELIAAKAKKQAQALAALGRRFDFDESLTSGLVEVLIKKPDGRSSFDNLVIQAFENQLKTRVAEIDKTLAEEAPGQESRLDVVNSAKNDQDAAKIVQESSASELKKASASVKEAQNAAVAAQRTVKALQKALLSAEAERSQALTRLKAFREGPATTLDTLRAAADDEALAAALRQFEEAAAAADAASAVEGAGAGDEEEPAPNGTAVCGGGGGQNGGAEEEAEAAAEDEEEVDEEAAGKAEGDDDEADAGGDLEE